MVFYLCFVKTRKKLDKYFKVNKIRNKNIIDIKKIIEDEGIDLTKEESKAFFKVLIWNKIKTSKDKKRDIYYIPNFNNNVNVNGLLKIKTNILHEDDQFNFLCFHDEFHGTLWFNELLENISVFDNSQIIEDY